MAHTEDVLAGVVTQMGGNIGDDGGNIVRVAHGISRLVSWGIFASSLSREVVIRRYEMSLAGWYVRTKKTAPHHHREHRGDAGTV